MRIREDPMIPALGVIDKSVDISSSRKDGSERNHHHKLKTYGGTVNKGDDADWSLIWSGQEGGVKCRNSVAVVIGINPVGSWECIIGLGMVALSTLIKVTYLHFSLLPPVWNPLGIPLGFVGGLIVQAILREYTKKPGISIPKGMKFLLAVGVLLPLSWWDCATAGAVVLTFTRSWWIKAATLYVFPSRKPVPNPLVGDLGVLFIFAAMGVGLPMLLGALTGGFLKVSHPAQVKPSSESTSTPSQKEGGIRQPYRQQSVKHHHPLKELDAFQPIYPLSQKSRQQSG